MFICVHVVILYGKLVRKNRLSTFTKGGAKTTFTKGCAKSVDICFALLF